MQDTTSINDLRQTIATAFSQPLASRDSTATVVDTQRTQTVADSPLTGEALLNRPLGSSHPPETKETKMAPITHSLAALLSGNPSATTESSPLATSVSSVASDKEVPAVIDVPAVSAPLLAEFLQDITVPDGQIFPPGAEFVKCWRFLNGSERDWPESTVLLFVAGESLARDESSSQSVEVGSVQAGSEVDLWTGELKVMTCCIN
jgi:next-to-BRCA1 protein 1